jgi:hypothetical protein
MSSKMLNQAFFHSDSTDEDYDTPVEEYDPSVISSVVWESDDEKYERQLLAMLDDAYDGWENPTWPQKRIMYPSVKFMVDHHAFSPTRPKALDPRLEQEMVNYKEQKDILWKKQKEANKAFDTSQKALDEEMKKPKAYSQKWSQRINGGETDAVKHLRIELERVKNTYEKAKDEFEKHEKLYSTLVNLVDAHKMAMTAYEDCMVLEKKLTKAMWGM